MDGGERLSPWITSSYMCQILMVFQKRNVESQHCSCHWEEELKHIITTPSFYLFIYYRVTKEQYFLTLDQ